MNQLDKIIKGCEILRRYGSEHLEPTHDQLFVSGPENIPEAEELTNLDWFYVDGHWSMFT